MSDHASIPSTMRAHIFTSTSPTLEANLALTTTAPLPPQAKGLAPNQSVVRVLATSINPADYKFPAFPIVGRFMVPRPSAPCIDFTGRVASTGSSKPFQEGALVFGRLHKPQKHGTLGEYVVASSDEVVPLPQGVSAEDAACVGTAGLIAYQTIVPHVKQGDNVFINGGSGGTGMFGIQVAKEMGCWVATTASSANGGFCKDLGADEVIDYKEGDVLEALKATGRKYQLVVDNVGTNPKLWAQMEQYTSPGAPLVQVGLPVSFWSIFGILKKTLWPSWLGAPKRKFMVVSVHTDAETLTHMGQWMADGKLKIVKDRVYAFEEAKAAFAQLRAGHARGKIVIQGPVDE